jgi:transcriptional regulator with XRE-family HTH domain
MRDIIEEDQQNRKALITELGKRIKLAREESKMSQLQVGVALAVSDKTISGYESGRIAPPIDKLMHIAELFKKPIAFFLGSDPREYKVASRLRSVEIALRDVRKQLNEIRLIGQNQDLDEN